MELTQQMLQRLVYYDPETGVFSCRKEGEHGTRKEGDILSSVDNTGYNRFRILGTKYLAHRLAWLYMTGSFPSNMIDHKNHDKQDNRWCNLREANHLSNSQNRKTPCVDKHRGKFRARICSNYKEIHVGYFDTAEEAANAYYAAKKQHHIFKD
jgi:hypothetical protein